MSRPRTYRTEGIVLKQTPLGEADRILALYTQDMGKVRAVAKGVRRTRSRLGGHLELLNRVSVSLALGRSLDIVTEAQAVYSFRGLREELARLSRALYVAELVDAFSAEQQANSEVYALLLDTLSWLESTDQLDLPVRYFEMHLLEHSGYRPELGRCVECRALLEPGDHHLSYPRGGVVCQECRVGPGASLVPISLTGMKVLRFLQREDSIRAASLKVSAQVLGELERLLRLYIRFLVERDLKSAEFVALLDRTRVS